MKLDWTDTTRYAQNDTKRVPRVYTAQIGKFNLSIHKHIDHDDNWVLSTDALNLRCIDLREENFEAAEKKAIIYLNNYLKEYVDLYETIKKAIPTDVKVYTIHWFGKTQPEVVTGIDFATAFQNAGYDAATLKSVDFYEEPENLTFEERIVLLDGERIYNETMLVNIRKAVKKRLLSKSKDEIIPILYMNRIWNIKIQDNSGCFLKLVTISKIATN